MVSNTRALSASSSAVPIRPRIRTRIRSRAPWAMYNPPARMARPTRVGTLRLGRTRSYTSSMNSEPVKYSRLIMQLMMPTPMKAPRQARSASPSSERRTPGAAAIQPDLFHEGAGTPVLPMFPATVHLSHINLNGAPKRGGATSPSHRFNQTSSHLVPAVLFPGILTEHRGLPSVGGPPQPTSLE